MTTIQLLPEHIANQIAAGEVVEGPSSIIKELVENSIDAGSTKIYVEVSKQFQRIQVSDNGSGIKPSEISLAFKRHATSKIQNIEDIYALVTNGFRGEALASIAAVSRLTCTSKRAEDDHATKIYIENGIETISQTGAANGTTIVVDDIFFNTPARLKFLKSNTKEKALITDLLRSFALANSSIAFTLKIDDKDIIRSTGSGELKAALGEVFKEDFSSKLIKVELEDGDITVSGFTSPTQVARNDKRGMFTFINGRIVQCYIMRSAIDAVYKKYLGPGKYPISIINLSIPAAEVDVNVHPSKKEVKYQNTNLIYRLIGDAISKAVSDSFYEAQASFQPSLEDHSIRHSAKPVSLFVQNADLEVLKENQSKYQRDFTYNLPKVSVNQIYEEQKNNRESYESEFSANNRKFVSRFGSVDVSIFDSSSLETHVSSQGSKTSFELVVKDDDFCKSVLLRGDFIGEAWVKDKYLEFLNGIGEEILEREKLNNNFKTVTKSSANRSRPMVNPSRKKLEEIWQRDNYTCVYCAKALLHPDTIKKSLNDCDDKVLLNSHLASYDHHLPASKFPVLNEDERNLYACCQECNIKKSDSLASKTWTPVAGNAWEDSLLIANLRFDKP